MLLGIIIAQLFGIRRETREVAIRTKYATSPNPELEEFAVFVFIMYVLIGTFAWPIAPAVNLWRSGYRAASIVLSISAFFFFIGALPIYLMWGFVWSVVKFTVTYL